MEKEKTSTNFEQPRSSAKMAQEYRNYMQWTNNANFYALIPAPYHNFYQNWVKTWLDWFDGYVHYIHGGSNGLMSTHIASTIVNRSTDAIIGGDIMFKDASKPSVFISGDNGKPISKGKHFISQWAKECDLRDNVKKGIRFALAGGFSLLKLNVSSGELWLDAIRADRFYVDLNARGKIEKVICAVSLYEQLTRKNGKRYWLIEERRYENIGLFDKVPVVEYKVYESTTPIEVFTAKDICVRYEDLPKDIRRALKTEFGAVRLNQPIAMNGFENLGVYMLKNEDLSSVPQLNLGQSMLANILTYLYGYDYCYTCCNTDMYLGRGRVLIPKAMQGQGKSAHSGTANSGLDDFIYTKVETMTTEEQKPEPIQFELRAGEWKELRNTLLENIATGIGQSVSTLASYLNDGSNRTAREVSAEESATSLFIENKRANFGRTINDMLKDVLRFNGIVDDIEVRWSKAGMTNLTVLVDNLSKAKQSGLISGEEAHKQFNFDMDDEQLALDYKKVEEDQAKAQNSIFGGFSGE